MLGIVLSFLGVIIMSSFSVYIWLILTDKRANVGIFKRCIFVLILASLLLLNSNSIFKFTAVTLLSSLLIKSLLKVPFKKGFVTVCFTQILNLLLELIYSILAISLFKINIDLEANQILLVFFADIFVSVGCLIISLSKPFKALYNILINVIDKVRLKHVLLAILPIVFVFNAYLATTYYKFSVFYVFVLNNISIYIIVIVILILIKKENAYLRMNDKYKTTLNSLKEYEDILDNYRILNHENKNQLLTVRNMISKNNKKVIGYIDEIINNKIKDNENLIRKTSIIPAGGLRGLIYSKILFMEQNKINYKLEFSKQIKTVDLINKIDDSDMLDICQIIGVYIDNSIQAVTKVKNKNIIIQMYIDNDFLVISVSNNYKGAIKIDKIEQNGYSTKGKNRGYGLALTKKIIDKNKKLSNEKKITKEIFTQMLKIKM